MKKIIIIVIIVILIIVAVFFFIRKNGSNQTDSAVEQSDKSTSSSIKEIGEKKQAAEDPVAALKARLGLQARFFIERYGTYSSDSNYNNLRAMEGQMTKSLFDKVMEEIDSKEPSTDFYSLETMVANVELTEFNQERVVFLAQVQEKELKSGQVAITPKETELIFIKDGEEWKVEEIN